VDEEKPTPSTIQGVAGKLIDVLPPSFVVLVLFLCVVFYHEGDMTAKRTEAMEHILVECIQKK